MMHDIDHRSGTRQQRDPAAALQRLTAALPPGWISLQDCDVSGVPGRSVPLHHVLLHAEIGVALLDIAPAATQGAEAALRRRLEAARFEGIFPGHLPVVHLRIAADEAGGLAALLEQAFATLPPLSVAGGDAWVSVVRRALSPRDPARGSTYRGMIPDDWPAAPQPAGPDRPHYGETAETARMSRDWPSEAPHEADFDDDPPSRWHRPWAWAALGLGSFAAVAALAVMVLAGGGPPSETATPHSMQAAPVAAAGTAAGVASPPAPAVGTAAAPAVGAVPNPSAAQRPAPGGTAAWRETPPLRTAEPAPPRAEASVIPPRRDGGAPAQAPTLTGAGVAAQPAEAAAPSQGQASRVVVVSAANLRSGPDKSFAVLRTASRGQNFRVHGRANGNWFQVGEAQPEGWVYGDLVREVRP